MTETIQQAVDRYIAAVEAIDQEALAELYEPDARVSDAMMGWRMTGDEWRERGIRQWLDVVRQPSTCAFEHMSVVESGDLGAVDADVTYAGPVEFDGRRMEANETARVTMVWRRGERGWRIAIEHSSKPSNEHGEVVERADA